MYSDCGTVGACDAFGAEIFDISNQIPDTHESVRESCIYHSNKRTKKIKGGIKLRKDCLGITNNVCSVCSCLTSLISFFFSPACGISHLYGNYIINPQKGLEKLLTALNTDTEFTRKHTVADFFKELIAD